MNRSRTQKRFTKEDDDEIIRLVHQYRDNWNIIAYVMEWKFKPKQIEEHFKSTLQKHIIKNRAWTKEEEKLIDFVKRYDSRWDWITPNFPGRCTGYLKHKFHQYLDRIQQERLEQLRQQQEEEETYERAIRDIIEAGTELLEEEYINLNLTEF